MSDYYGYVSVDALMDFAHNHVNGMIDSNDIARFPIANVKDANEQQSLQEIFGVAFDRLRELAEAEREGRVVVLPCKVGATVYAIRIHECDICEHYDEHASDCEFKCPRYIDEELFELWMVDDKHRIPAQIFFTRAEAERALAAADAGKGD